MDASTSTPNGAPSAAMPAAPNAATATTRKRLPWSALLVMATLLIAATGFGARLYWRSLHFADTDNAFISGHVHPVSARVAGVVTAVEVQDNASVRAGQALVQLDAADQQVQIERLQALIVAAQAQLGGTGTQVAQSRAQASAAQAQVLQAQALLARAQLEADRAQQLHSGELRFISRQSLDAALMARDAAAAELQARRATVLAAGEQVAGGANTRDAARAQIDVLQAQLKDARQQLSYTSVLAPGDGRVGKRTVEVGQRVSAGQQLLAIVGPQLWITANFKETQLGRMKPGQRARIKLDAFPDRDFSAQVHSFAPASGAQFALLPPDNATGNYTKIVQRVPVKLVFDEAEIATLKERIVPGMSVTVSVDLRS
jgi:membrane fusion protein, multidrug efflux system